MSYQVIDSIQKAMRVASVDLSKLTGAATVAKGGLPPISSAKIEAALRGANLELYEWLARRSAAVHYSTILGPNFDGSYFYRLGNRGTDGYGMTEEQLRKTRDQLIASGFPRLQPDEQRLINFTNYAARRRALPNTRITAKHFPGGDETLELTEETPVYFDDPARVTEWVRDYQRLIEGDAPQLIMLGHARYTPKGFPGIDATETGPLAKQRFEDIPASLNPAMVRYLREKIGFKGLVVADWYDMGAITAYAKNQDLGFQASTEVKIVVMATMAGVDFVTGVLPTEFTGPNSAGAFQRMSAQQPELYAQFTAALDASLLRMWSTFSARDRGGARFDPAALPVAEKILLKLYNPKQSSFHELYDGYLTSNPENQAVFRVFMQQGVGDFDVWNRVGVMTLIQRQKIIEKLAGHAFAPLPTRSGDEERWYDQLMRNREFRSYYDRIDWGSAEMQRIYNHVLDERYPRFASAAH